MAQGRDNELDASSSTKPKAGDEAEAGRMSDPGGKGATGSNFTQWNLARGVRMPKRLGLVSRILSKRTPWSGRMMA